MNIKRIEQVLRKAPPIAVPPGLLDRLEKNVAVASAARAVRTERPSRGSWLRRWMPALGFTLWFFGCMVVFGVQASRIAELRQRNRALEEASAAQTQGSVAAGEQTSGNSAAAAQFARDRAEIEQLRAEVQQLQAEIAQFTQLRAENQRLRAELNSKQPTPLPKPENDFFVVQQEQASRIQCVNSLKQFCLAARLWANDSKTDALPPNAQSLRPYLQGGDRLLGCPKDGTPYEILSPNAPESRPDVVYVRCRVHNTAGMVDGSVQQFNPAKMNIVQRDGVWVLQRVGEYE